MTTTESKKKDTEANVADTAKGKVEDTAGGIAHKVRDVAGNGSPARLAAVPLVIAVGIVVAIVSRIRRQRNTPEKVMRQLKRKLPKR